MAKKNETTVENIQARFPRDTRFSGTELAFVPEEGQYGVIMSGYYTASELRVILGDTVEANRWFNAMERVLVRLEGTGHDPADPATRNRSFLIEAPTFSLVEDIVYGVPYEAVYIERGVVLDKVDYRLPADTQALSQKLWELKQEERYASV